MAEQKKLKNRKTAEYIQDLTALGNPFLLLLVSFCATQGTFEIPTWKIWAILSAGFLINELICSTIKFFWHKPRPNSQTYLGGLEKIDAGSFPSIHAARISFVYSSLAYLQYTENQSIIFIIICSLVILLVGYSRVFLKKHFLIDVLAGYIFGFFMSIVMWQLVV
jgi:membrane-associated phospholipid phosphatase